MVTRAGILVTGTEVLTGRVGDANGPWLAEQLRVLGVDVGRSVVVGDRPEDLRAALRFLAADHDLVITTGGLGPTADDLTAEIVAEVQGRTPVLDPDLEQRITAIVERLTAARGWTPDPGATRWATRKQAHVPEWAHVLEPVGTAPGLVVPPADGVGPPVLVLPGPPYELQGMWDAAVADPLVAAALAGRVELRQQTLRLWGTPESELAATLRAHDAELTGLEITTCLREGGELEIVTRFSPAASDAYDALVAAVRHDFAHTLFSEDGRTVAEIVTDTLLARQATVATAESCTAGLLAARLADRPGSSAYLLGGLVTYANDAKRDLLGVPQQLLDEVGAVSAEVAQAMADGARARLGATIGVGITGIAGPSGATEGKPVGLVHLCVSDGETSIERRVVLPGSRAAVRSRAVVVALHLLRVLLDPPAVGG